MKMLRSLQPYLLEKYYHLEVPCFTDWRFAPGHRFLFASNPLSTAVIPALWILMGQGRPSSTNPTATQQQVMKWHRISQACSFYPDGSGAGRARERGPTPAAAAVLFAWGAGTSPFLHKLLSGSIGIQPPPPASQGAIPDLQGGWPAGDVILREGRYPSCVVRGKHISFLPGLSGESQLREALVLSQMGVDGVFAPFGGRKWILQIRGKAIRSDSTLGWVRCC